MSTTTNTNKEPLQPEWPMNVMVFKPSDDIDYIKKKIAPTQDPIKKFKFRNGQEMMETHTSEHHFTTKHYALLFTPGEYKNCHFEIGYYTQMIGLGKTVSGHGAVNFTGEKSGPYVTALDKDMPPTEGGTIAYEGSGQCLDVFWRSAENFTSEKTQWAVSQAAPLRRVHITKELMFGDGGAYASGGFLANAVIEGNCNFAANQQWFSRGVDFQGTVCGGAWSNVFSGCVGNVPKPSVKVESPVTTVDVQPNVRLEKPYIVINDNDGSYELHVPKVITANDEKKIIGPHLDGSHTDVRCFSQVKVGKPFLPIDSEGNYTEINDATYNVTNQDDEDLTLELQHALDEGKDLVLCPGVFFLTKPLIIKHPNQVILGLGLATLVAPHDGSPCIRVRANVPGVRIAGLMLEASKQIDSIDTCTLNSDGVKSLLEFGEPHIPNDIGDASNPGLLSDIFARVGGSNLDRTVKTDVMVRIHSGNVIGDNLWLWRADHVRLDKAIGEKPNDPNFPYYHQVRIWEWNHDGTEKIKVNECIVKTALEVRGDHVTMYGLFCEHTTEHQLIWSGDHGTVTFYQCELPYDVDIEYSHDQFTGYLVHDDVHVHTAKGIGVYTNFQVYDVHAPFAIQVPSKEHVVLENPFSVYLSNHGGIKNVVKHGKALKGGAVKKGNQLSRPWIGRN